MSRIIICFAVLILIVLAGCKNKEYVNQLTSSEVKERLKSWELSAPVLSNAQILGEWSSSSKDVPNGSSMLSWSLTFMKEGYFSETVELSNCATAPAGYFKISKSKLYLSYSKDEKPDEYEMRINGKILYLKSSNRLLKIASI